MAWLINSRGIAKKVKNATCYSNYQIRDLGAEAKRECPNCQCIIDNSDVSLEWPGLPAGVKFDPTGAELLDHLAGKIRVGNAKAHTFIDEFISTLDGDQGICYTHPENLPGVRKDGSSAHFFHRSSNAYATGHRKRRKIYGGCCELEERVRWHKTGKTKQVKENGISKGWKKIMVLYRSSGKVSKTDKVGWVMHQYHLGMDEEEKDGELVVSKIFYQQTKQKDRNEAEPLPEELNASTIRIGPKTPKTMTPQPPRTRLNLLHEDDEHAPPVLAAQEEELPEVEPIVHLKGEDIGSTWWAGESQAIEEPDPNKIDESLLCREVLGRFPPIGESSPHLHYQDRILNSKGQLERDANTAYGFPLLDDIEVGTPPDFQLSDLQFGSQDSILTWLDRL